MSVVGHFPPIRSVSPCGSCPLRSQKRTLEARVVAGTLMSTRPSVMGPMRSSPPVIVTPPSSRFCPWSALRLPHDAIRESGGCSPSPDAWGRLNVVTPFHHLSEDSHIARLEQGPLRHLVKS